MKRKRNYILKIHPIILLIPLFWACEEIGEDIVNPATIDDSVLEVSAPSSFAWNASDSSFSTYVDLRDPSNTEIIEVSVLDRNGENQFEFPYILSDDGSSESGDLLANDGVYSGHITMSSLFSSGTYNLEYKAILREGDSKKIAVLSLDYDNGQRNVAPVLSNLDLPASITREISFVFTVTVFDQNGLADIDRVIFRLKRPDGTVVQPSAGQDFFLMDDTGNLEVFGDETAADGIYSFKNSFASTAQTGNWEFEFTAIDNSGAESNVLVQNVEVQ